MGTELSDLNTEQTAALRTLHFFENATPATSPTPDYLVAAALTWTLPQARGVLAMLARFELVTECRANLHERNHPALETGDFRLPGGRVATVRRETAADGGPRYLLDIDGVVTYSDVCLNRHAISIPRRRLAEPGETPMSRPFGVGAEGRLGCGLTVELPGTARFIDFIEPYGFNFETLGYGLSAAGYLLATRAAKAAKARGRKAGTVRTLAIADAAARGD